MQPQITEVTQFTLVGMSFYGDPFDLHSGWDDENHIGLLWKRCMRFLRSHPEVKCQPGAAFEVHIYGDETQEKGLFEVFVGLPIELRDAQELPANLSLKILPATQYAVFTFTGEQISADWESILEVWISKSGYQACGAFNLQYYDERFKGLDQLEQSVLDVYFPIKKNA